MVSEAKYQVIGSWGRSGATLRNGIGKPRNTLMNLHRSDLLAKDIVVYT
jgi:hypothetical protein